MTRLRTIELDAGTSVLIGGERDITDWDSLLA